MCCCCWTRTGLDHGPVIVGEWLANIPLPYSVPLLLLLLLPRGECVLGGVAAWTDAAVTFTDSGGGGDDDDNDSCGGGIVAAVQFLMLLLVPLPIM